MIDLQRVYENASKRGKHFAHRLAGEADREPLDDSRRAPILGRRVSSARIASRASNHEEVYCKNLRISARSCNNQLFRCIL